MSQAPLFRADGATIPARPAIKGRRRPDRAQGGTSSQGMEAKGAIEMSLSGILIVLVIVFVIATVPIWPYSRAWGFWPSGLLTLLLVALFGVLLLG